MDLSTLSLLAAVALGVGITLCAVWRFEWFVLILLVVRPMLDGLTRGGDVRGGLDAADAVGAVLLVFGSLWLVVQRASGRWVRPSIATWSLLGLVLASALSTIRSADPATTMQATTKVAAGALMFALIEQLVARGGLPAARRVVLAAFASLAIPAGVALAQLTRGVTPDAESGVSRLSSVFVHPNVFASYLVALVVVAVALTSVAAGGLRKAAWAVTVAGGGFIVVTYARVAWLALLAALIYLGIRHNRKLLVSVVAVGLTVVAAVPSVVTRFSDLGDAQIQEDIPPNSLAWRISYWGDVLPLAEDSRLVGIGLEMTQKTTEVELQPHNVFVQAWVETGVIGFAALCATIVAFAVTLRRRIRTAASGPARTLALAALAVALAVFVQLFTENLLTSTLVWWYTAAAMTFGLAERARPEPLVAPRPLPNRITMSSFVRR